MKAIVFDSGPIISLTLNNLLWTLKHLKKKFGGEFYITKEVKSELIDHPIKTRKFKFEAFQVLKEINQGVLKVYDSPYVNKKTVQIMRAANNIFSIKGKSLKLIHTAEVSAIAACIELEAKALVMDERMTRLFIENPKRIQEIIKKHFHATCEVKKEKLEKLHREFKSIGVIRSTELMTIAYEQKLLDQYINNIDIPSPKLQLLDALLWGLKLNGCSISEMEIRQLMKIQRYRN